MDYQRSLSLIEFLSNKWFINNRGFCVDILQSLYQPFRQNERNIRVFNEFSFICDKDQRLEKKIRILNLLFIKGGGKKTRRDIKQGRLKALINVLPEKFNLCIDFDKLSQLMLFVNQNDDWLLQFGLEVDTNYNLRLKIYFGQNSRKQNNKSFIVKMLEKIADLFVMEMPKSTLLPIFFREIDAVAIDFITGGYSLKIYDYSHFPNKKNLDQIIEGHKLINSIDKDNLFDYFCRLIKKNRFYGRRNFDTMITYRFQKNSFILKETKINIHIQPHLNPSKLLGDIILKENYDVFSFFEKNKIKVSFIGHQPGEFFFYVR